MAKRTRRELLKTAVVAVAASCLLVRAGVGEEPSAGPPLTARPYQIGVAPSHVTESPEALFAPDAQRKSDFHNSAPWMMHLIRVNPCPISEEAKR